jgi:hypothetical protein
VLTKETDLGKDECKVRRVNGFSAEIAEENSF